MRIFGGWLLLCRQHCREFESPKQRGLQVVASFYNRTTTVSTTDFIGHENRIDMQDIRLITKPDCKEPYKAIIHGRNLYRRCNEKLSQFEARVHHAAAKIRESAWY